MSMQFKDFPLSKVGNECHLVAGVWADNDGNHYMCLFPEYRGRDGTKNELHSLDLSTEDWQALLKQSDLMETEVTARAKDGTEFKAVLRKCQRQIEQGVSWNVFKRDGYSCRYCGRSDVPLTVDHVVLWEEGGPSTEDNLVSACRKCNKVRGRMPYLEWLGSRYYLEVSKNLPPFGKEKNWLLVDVVDNIPRVNHVRSR